MSKSPIIHGAIAKISIWDEATNRTIVTGIFTSCAWSVSYDTHVAHTLGRHEPQAITYTGREAIRMTLTGFRVAGGSPFQILTVPALKDLMNTPGIKVTIQQRGGANGKSADSNLVEVGQCFATDFSTGVNARSVSDVSVSLIGIEYREPGTPEEGGAGINPSDLSIPKA